MSVLYRNGIEISKVVCLICFLLFVVIIPPSFAFGDGDTQVRIIADEQNYGDYGFSCKVTVVFNDLALYNEHVMLSYHVFTPDGKDLAIFENPRIPMNIDENGIAVQVVSVDEISQPMLEGIETAIVRFDLVDESNLYWFLDNTNIVIQTMDLRYDTSLKSGNPQKQSTESYSDEVQSEDKDIQKIRIIPLIFCLTGWGFLAVVLFAIKKEKLH